MIELFRIAASVDHCSLSIFLAVVGLERANLLGPLRPGKAVKAP